MRDATNKLLQRQMEDAVIRKLKNFQKDLNEIYDSFTAKYGFA